ncbi:MAG TPA: MFS transporter [Chloroflexia bacterium]|nr:MFS transporter [Chloroflexia bacterium]
MSTQEPQYQAPANGWRTFLIVWGTQSVSVFGSALTWFAITIWLTQTLYARPEQKPELAFALTILGLTYIITLMVAPFAGAWADRHDRKHTMMTVDFILGVQSLVLMTLLLTSSLQLWMLLLLVAVEQLFAPFHYSAFDTSYAMLVPEERLARANGMMQTIFSLSSILSPAIAASIIALPSLARQGLVPGVFGDWLAPLKDGAALAIGVDAVTFFLASGILLFLTIPSPKRADLQADGTDGKKKSVWADIKEGAMYIKRRPPLLWLLATFTVINFASSPVELFVPLLLKFNLAGDWQSHGFTFESALALLSMLGGIGGVVGGVIMSAWGGLKRKRVYGVVVPILIAAAVQIVYGLSPYFFLTCGTMFFLIGLIPIMNSHSQTIWQSQVPRELQGRVFSVRRVIAQFSAPVSTLLAGLASAQFNPGVILAILGTITVVFCIAQLFNPYLLKVENKQFLDELATQRGEPLALAMTTAEAQIPPTLLEQ